MDASLLGMPSAKKSAVFLNIVRKAFDPEAQLLTGRSMRQTCGFVAVPAATAAQQRDRVGDFQARKSTAKQSEK